MIQQLTNTCNKCQGTGKKYIENIKVHKEKKI